jgi:PKD repeat protein
VSFDATPSSDVDGEVTSYFWTFGDGSSTAGSSEVSHSFTKAGSFPVKLTVTDNDGAQAFYEQTIVVQAALPALPVYPLADFIINPQDPMVKQLVQFSGSASKAAVGRKITRYLWTFGDGKSATGIITSYRYRVAGTYTVQLTVWDDLGVSNKKSVTLTVKNVVR